MTNEFFRFRKFPVYKKAREFRKKWKKIIKEKFPKEEIYALSSQFGRALDSIVLNIAEGADRYSDKDFSRFLNNSITSVAECAACIDCAYDDEYISEREYNDGLKEAEGITRQLKALSGKVRADSRKR